MASHRLKPYCTRVEWVGRARCSVCEVRNMVLFAGLSPLELDAILQPIDNLHVPQHAVLYEQDSPASFVYTLRHGTIKLAVDLANGARRIVRLLKAGDVVGLEALVDRRYHHTAIAMQDADVCRIPRDVITRLDQTNPGVHRSLIERWQCSLDQADQFIVSLSTGPSEARVARLLVMLGCAGRVPASLPSREEMGALLGITTETASRVMADFKRRGLVRAQQGNEVVCDHAGLVELTHG